MTHFTATRDGQEYHPPIWKRPAPVISYVCDVDLLPDDDTPAPAVPLHVGAV